MPQPLPTPWTLSSLADPLFLRRALLASLKALSSPKPRTSVVKRLIHILRCWSNDFGPYTYCARIPSPPPRFLLHMLRCSGSGPNGQRAEYENEASGLKEACDATGFSLFFGRFVWYKRICEDGPWTGRLSYTACELSSPRDMNGNELKGWSDVNEEDLLDHAYWYREACKDLEVGEMGEVFSREVLIIVPPHFASEFVVQAEEEEEGDEMDVDDMDVDETSENLEEIIVCKAPEVLMQASKKRRAMDEIEPFSAKRQVMNLAWAQNGLTIATQAAQTYINPCYEAAAHAERPLA